MNQLPAKKQNTEADVTVSSKRYIAVCRGCDLMFETSRKDQLTCSDACRVKAHRNGSLKALRDFCKAFDIEPHMLVQADAAKRLGLNDKVMSREIELDGNPQIVRAFYKRIFDYVEAEAA